MSKLKLINQADLKDWAKEIFQKNSFNMIDVSSKKQTFRRALASGKIYVGKEVFKLIKDKKEVIRLKRNAKNLHLKHFDHDVVIPLLADHVEKVAHNK